MQKCSAGAPSWRKVRPRATLATVARAARRGRSGGATPPQTPPTLAPHRPQGEFESTAATGSVRAAADLSAHAVITALSIVPPLIPSPTSVARRPAPLGGRD